MQDRLVEAESLGEIWIRVQRVPVAGQTVQQRLVEVGLLLDHRVRLARRRDVDVAGRAALAAPAAGAAHESGDLVIRDLLAAFVGGGNAEQHHRVRRLVVGALEAEGVLELAFGRERVFDLGVLLAVQHAVEAVVQTRHRRLAVLGHGQHGVHRRHHGVGRQHVEAAAVQLVHQGQVLLVQRVGRRADAEGVQRHVVLGVRGLDRGLGLGSEVEIDELVAAQALRVHVGQHRGHRLVDVRRVFDFLEVGDLVPLLGHVVRAEGAADLEAVALGALPAQLADVTGADLEQAAGLLAVLVAQPADQRRDELRLQRRDQLRRQHRLGQAAASDGGDGVAMDVLVAALDRQGVGQAEDAKLGRRVIGLAEVAVDAGGRGGHDDAAVALVAHHRPGGVRHGERALQVHALDQIPVFRRHLLEAGVAQDAGVVDDDVDGAEGVKRGLHDFGAVFHRVVVGHRLAAERLDLRHHLVRRRAGLAAAVDVAAEIVHHHLGAAGAEQQRVLLAQAVAGAGDDDHLVVVTKLLSHATPSVYYC